jgi:hypothetical protein
MNDGISAENESSNRPKRARSQALPHIVRHEFRPAIPRSSCSPAEPISASPARAEYLGPSKAWGQRGHFYFARKRTFLFCLDIPSFTLDAAITG